MTSTLTYISAATLVIYVSCSKPLQDPPVLTRVTEPVLHGEGPHWDPVDNVLYYVDISGNSLHRYDPATKIDKSLKLGQYTYIDKPVAVAVPIKGERQKFVVGLGRDYVVLTWDWGSGAHNLSTLTSVDRQNLHNRFNDGKADAKGRVWAGTMGHEETVGHVAPNKGSLYRLDKNADGGDCTAVTALHPVNISNGLTWSRDNQVLYYIDSPTRRVDAFDYDLETGDISNQRTVFEYKDLPGSPDGMTIDADGKLWIASWGGSQVLNVDPHSGTLLRTVQLPVSLVSSVAWGGPGPALNTLYVTTMRLGLTPAQQRDQPHAGSVWQITGLNTTGALHHPAVVNCQQAQ